MSERVVWVVEIWLPATQEWIPDSGRTFHDSVRARHEAEKAALMSKGVKFRAWPYVAKESAQ